MARSFLSQPSSLLPDLPYKMASVYLHITHNALETLPSASLSGIGMEDNSAPPTLCTAFQGCDVPFDWEAGTAQRLV